MWLALTFVFSSFTPSAAQEPNPQRSSYQAPPRVTRLVPELGPKPRLGNLVSPFQFPFTLKRNPSTGQMQNTPSGLIAAIPAKLQRHLAVGLKKITLPPSGSLHKRAGQQQAASGRMGGQYDPSPPGPPSHQSLIPAQTDRAVEFTDLPLLDQEQKPVQEPNPVQEPRINRPQNQGQPSDQDIAPSRDLRDQGQSDPVETLPDSVPQRQGGGIPFDAPPVENFESNSGDRIYEQIKPDPRTKFPMWWDEKVIAPQLDSAQHWNIDVNDLVEFFLRNSPRLKAINLVRESAEPAVPEKYAEFDPTAFVESNFVRLNDPVGNTLTTGGADRFRDNNWTTRAGLRKKFHQGGSFEAFQRFGIQTNNSDFFVPRQQGTSYLSLNFTQPLLNGRGRLYNDSLIAIAELEKGLASGVAEEKIQTELLALTKNYWKLYSYRAIWFQKKENVRRAEKIYNELLGRKDFDVSKTQLLRAKAAVATRKAVLVQAWNRIRDVESELSAMLGIPIQTNRFEYVPSFVPNLFFPKIDLRDAFVTALSNRPEIIQAGQRVQIAAEKANRSKHEVLPVLDLVLGTYVSGLHGNYEIFNAFGGQFSEGAPGYSAALNFEVPIYQRAAKARLERDQFRWKAITSELEDQILKVQSEVDIAIRDVQTSHRRLVAQSVAMESARAEMDAQQERLELSFGGGDNIGNTLNFLLDAQDRLAEQENLLAQAQADYMVSWVALKKAMGTLVLIESGQAPPPLPRSPLPRSTFE